MKLMSVQSSYDLQVSKELMVNSCNLQLGKMLGQGDQTLAKQNITVYLSLLPLRGVWGCLSGLTEKEISAK